MAKKLRIIWVDSWHDIKPATKGEGGFRSGLTGYHNPNTNTTYLIRGKSSKADEKHEEYHSIKEHSGHPKQYKMFVRQELEAEKYSYDQIGQPHRIVSVLRGIYNDLILHEYDIEPPAAYETMKSEFARIDPPMEWINDWKLFTDGYVETLKLDKWPKSSYPNLSLKQLEHEAHEREQSESATHHNRKPRHKSHSKVTPSSSVNRK